MAIPKELKEAIVLMPPAEKDKLLLRLVTKDETLIQRLEFELLEQGQTLESRRDEIKKHISRCAKMDHYTPGLMMMDMRDLSGDIGRHVKVTKDKYGEVELNLYLLNAFFDHQLDHLRLHNGKSDSCAEYIAKKTATILKNANKFDEDYHIEFEADIQKLLDRVHNNCPKTYARDLKIPKNWP